MRTFNTSITVSSCQRALNTCSDTGTLLFLEQAALLVLLLQRSRKGGDLRLLIGGLSTEGINLRGGEVGEGGGGKVRGCVGVVREKACVSNLVPCRGQFGLEVLIFPL